MSALRGSWTGRQARGAVLLASLVAVSLGVTGLAPEARNDRVKLRTLASTAAGLRLREFRRVGALFPGGLVGVRGGIPLGGVIGITMELGP